MSRRTEPSEDHLVGGVPLVGVSPGIRALRDTIRRFAPTPLSVLLIGETGTGKELCARALHALGGRVGKFVPIDCAALPATLLQSELFGRVRGAYTGAVTDSDGLVAAARGGTLFLDEVCSLVPEGQAALLRTLETREVRALGQVATRRADIRIVAAMQPPGAGGIRFELREDLLHRLGGVVLRLPSLRQRREDIMPLAGFLAAGVAATLAPGVREILMAREWPGNVRELKAVVERATALAGGSVVGPGEVRTALELGLIPAAPRRMTGGGDPKAASRAELVQLLEAHSGDTERVAEVLGVSRRTVYRRCRALGISVADIGRALEWHDTRQSGDDLGTSPGVHVAKAAS